MIKAIVAVDENYGIGKDGKLLAYIKEDLKFFKEKTLNSTVILGRKTLDTFPNKKVLPNRKNIILSRNKDLKIENALIFNSKKEVLKYLNNENNVYIIGGAEIYKLFFDLIDEIYLTKIYYNFDADTFFKNIEKDSNFILETSSGRLNTESGFDIEFFKYKRKN